jgi:hypothetical protein
VEVGRSPDAERDDEKLLASEGFDQRSFIVVADLDGLDAVGERALAVLPDQGRDGVLACLQQRLGKGSADPAGGLTRLELA